MEAEERPSKLRKLSHSRNDDDMPMVKQEAAIGASSDIPTNNDPAKLENTANGANQESGADQENDAGVGGHEDDDMPAPADVAPSVTAADAGSADPPMSKNQRKKMLKKAEWEAKREDRKVIRKEKQAAKRERQKEAKRLEAETNPDAVEQRKQQQKQKAVQLPITFLIDCDFDGLMRDGERVSLASQITRCYSDTKNAPFRSHMTICSFGGQLRERFDTIIAHHKQWKGVRFFDEDFVEAAEKAKEWMSDSQSGQLAGVFQKYADLDEAAQAKLKDEGEIVYLTSEAEEDLMELKPYSTYIIGGLVDKNREKGICYKRATKRNVRTAKLPIGQYLDMASRKVLTTNHVNEIMLKWLECGDWGDAFIKVIPKRKGGQLKKTDGEAEHDPHSDDAASEGGHAAIEGGGEPLGATNATHKLDEQQLEA